MKHFRDDSGRLCLDLVSTLHAAGTADETEQLTGPPELATWIIERGTSLTRLPSEGQVRYAQRLREAVRELVEEPLISAYTRDRINEAALHPVPVPALSPAGHVQWAADDPVLATLSLVARDAIDLVSSPLQARVRACANPGCGDLFLDSSRPGTRRWCSMDRCGNRAKKRARVSTLT